MKNFLTAVDRIVCGEAFRMWTATQGINRQIVEAESLFADDAGYEKKLVEIRQEVSGLTAEKARAYCEDARGRQARIEDKAKICLLGLSLSVSAFFAGAKFVLEVVAGGSWILVLLLGAGVSALLAAWWISMWALCLRRRFQISPNLESSCENDPQTLAAIYVWLARLNELVATEQANAVYVGFQLSFRGVLCLSLFVIFSTIVLLKRG